MSYGPKDNASELHFKCSFQGHPMFIESSQISFGYLTIWLGMLKKVKSLRLMVKIGT